MRWSPVYKTLAVPGTSEVLLSLNNATVPTVTMIDLVTDKDVLLFFGPDAPVPLTLTNSFLLKGGESYGESGIMVSGEIRFMNAVPGEQPTVRGIVWGR